MSESRKEIYTYQAPWPIFGLAWSHRASSSAKVKGVFGIAKTGQVQNS